MSAIKGRKLSIENATLIGQGYNADVYLFDDENVVKVLKYSSFEDADREIQLSKWALKKGIPTAISYDVVDVDGRPGLIYESLGRNNLRNVLRDTPEQFDEVVGRYIELLQTVNSIVVEEGELPDAIDEYRSELEAAKGAMTAAEYEKMSRLLDTVPKKQNLVHGDFHVKNIKIVRGELLLIDLDTLRCGDALFELSPLCRSYDLYIKDDGCDIDAFFDLDKGIISRLLNEIFRGYFPNVSAETMAENRRKVELLSYMYMVYWYAVEENCPDVLESMYARFRELLAECDDLILKYV